MKFLLILVLSLIVIVPAFATPLSDRTGLKSKFDVDVGNKTYVVETLANFDIDDVKFDNDTLVFKISNSLENNIVELQVPQNLTKGTVHWFLDKHEVTPKTLTSPLISFVTLEFKGNGTHVLEVKSDLAIKPQELQITPGYSTSPVTVFLIAAIGVIAAGTGILYKKRKTTR